MQIDFVLLSCRVIGRGIETALLAYFASKQCAMERNELVGESLPQENALCAEFYPEKNLSG